jgi:hypothetical protein
MGRRVERVEVLSGVAERWELKGGAVQSAGVLKSGEAWEVPAGPWGVYSIMDVVYFETSVKE